MRYDLLDSVRIEGQSVKIWNVFVEVTYATLDTWIDRNLTVP